MASEVTKFYADFLWVNPVAAQAQVVDALLPTGDAPATTWPCRITTERKRVRDRMTGKRATQDWKVGHFLLWVDGEGAPDLKRAELRSIFEDAKKHGVDEIIVHGQRALISSPSVTFRQFGVRDFATIPNAS